MISFSLFTPPSFYPFISLYIFPSIIPSYPQGLRQHPRLGIYQSYFNSIILSFLFPYIFFITQAPQGNGSARLGDSIHPFNPSSHYPSNLQFHTPVHISLYIRLNYPFPQYKGVAIAAPYRCSNKGRLNLKIFQIGHLIFHFLSVFRGCLRQPTDPEG